MTATAAAPAASAPTVTGAPAPFRTEVASYARTSTGAKATPPIWRRSAAGTPAATRATSGEQRSRHADDGGRVGGHLVTAELLGGDRTLPYWLDVVWAEVAEG